jgi:Tol biopolymer transport system component
VVSRARIAGWFLAVVAAALLAGPAAAATNQLTSSPGTDDSAAYSPDGGRVAFLSDRGGSVEVYVMSADGSAVKQLTATGRPKRNFAWSPDGTRIAFEQTDPRPGTCCGSAEIYVAAPARSTSGSLRRPAGRRGRSLARRP